MVRRMARKTGSHAEITGPAVRRAALELFAQHGYAAVSMRQIAAEVDMRAGALYLYTPDKQTLLFDLMVDHLDDLMAAWSEADQGGTPTERLEAFVRFHIRFHLERPSEVFLAYMELRNLTAENFAAIEEKRGHYEDVLGAILSDGQADGTFAIIDVRVTTMALIAMLTGLTTWFRDDGRLSREDVEEMYVDMVRRMVSP